LWNDVGLGFGGINMNTKKTTQEQISAFADGELSGSHIDVALAALRQPDGKASWDVYHQIGDVLRSDDMAVSLSPGFAARMAARLDAEPTIVAPVSALAASRDDKRLETGANGMPAIRAMKRFALPGIAAAAAAAFALVSGPQLMVAMKGEPASGDIQVATAPAARTVSHASIIPTAASQLVASASGNPKDAVMLRDPNIDEYLLAHQRFSPSVYSTAQFARSTMFANESDK